MVSFHPHDFNFMPGIRELADIRKKLPVLFGEPPEIEITEDVSEENEALELRGLQKLQRIPGAAYPRADKNLAGKMLRKIEDTEKRHFIHFLLKPRRILGFAVQRTLRAAQRYLSASGG